MAMITGVQVRTPMDGNVEVWEWGPMANGDTGTLKVGLAFHGDKSWHAYGTFGAGGTVTIYGSNESTPTDANAGILHDPGGANLTLTATAGASVKQQLEAPYAVGPRVAGDGTTSLTVRLCIRRG